jgi:hypothetical protein
MGRNSNVACVDCREAYSIGYGSSTTWLDHVDTVAAFDAIEGSSNQQKNRAWRRFLVEHQGHDFVRWADDYATEEADGRVMQYAVMGEGDTLICNVAGFRRFADADGAWEERAE